MRSKGGTIRKGAGQAGAAGRKATGSVPGAPLPGSVLSGPVLSGRLLRAGLVAALLATAACSPLTRTHGYVPDEAALAQITPGVDTRETVRAALGSPSAQGLPGSEDFYYVASAFERLGIFEPREVTREVVAVSFDASGRVRNIERFGLEQGRVVALSRRVTEETVRDTTFIRQLMGNIGRFDAATVLGEEPGGTP